MTCGNERWEIFLRLRLRCAYSCVKKQKERKKKIVYSIENIEDEDFIAQRWKWSREPGSSWYLVRFHTSLWAQHRPKREANCFKRRRFLCYKISLKQITKENDFTRIILHSSFSPLYTYIRKTVNVVGHGSSNVGPTICSLGLFIIFVIILRSVPGRPAFSVKLDSEVLVAHVTCYQRTLTYSSVHIVPVNERSEICIQCGKSTARRVFITTNRLKFR